MSGIGHLAHGLVAKNVTPKAPLWVFLLAGETNDLLYFAFTAAGIGKPATTTMNFSEGVTYFAQELREADRHTDGKVDMV